MANADKGVSSAGLITTVHPQARAAAAFEYMEPINDILLFFVFSLKHMFYFAQILIVLYIYHYTFLAIIALGKFHGVIIPATPRGTLIVTISFVVVGLGIV